MRKILTVKQLIKELKKRDLSEEVWVGQDADGMIYPLYYIDPTVDGKHTFLLGEADEGKEY